MECQTARGLSPLVRHIRGKALHQSTHHYKDFRLLGFLQHPSTVGAAVPDSQHCHRPKGSLAHTPHFSHRRTRPGVPRYHDAAGPPALSQWSPNPERRPGPDPPGRHGWKQPCLQQYSCNGSYVMRADSSALTLRLVWQSLGETLPAHIRRTYNGTAEPSAGLRRECKLPIWRELHLGGPQSLIQFVSFTH